MALTRSMRADSLQKTRAILDRLAAAKVKARDGYRCVICHSGTGPEWAHFFPRARLATRWRLDAACTLCERHHRWYTKHPNAWALWLEARLGRERYAELLALSLRVKVVDYAAVRVELEAA